MVYDQQDSEGSTPALPLASQVTPRPQLACWGSYHDSNSLRITGRK